MNYEINVKEVEPIRVAYIRYHGKADMANSLFPQVFKSVKGKSTGAPFFNFIKMDESSKIGDIELSLPTNEIPNSDSVLVKNIPRTKVVSTIHVGSYESINKAYEAIRKYISTNKIIVTESFREIYIKGPGIIFKGDKNKYITEIQFDIREI